MTVSSAYQIEKIRNAPKIENYYVIVPKGVARGKGGNPRETEKSCRKIVLFPKALFLVINFPKNKNKIKLQFSDRIFIKIFHYFL